MRATLAVVTLILLSLTVTSCADTPTAPKAMVTATGTILDRDGNPMQAVYLYFLDMGPRVPGTDPATFWTATNINGTYTTSLPEGRYRIYIYPPSFSAYAGTILENQDVGRKGLRLDYKFAWIRVAIRPTISGGQTASDLRAEIYSQISGTTSGQTRLAGNEREAFVPPGTYDIYLQVSGVGFGYVSQELTAQVSSDTTIDVAFTGNAISVHVAGQGGTPLDQTRIFASAPRGGASALTDGIGNATLYLPSGTYQIAAYAYNSEVMGRYVSDYVVGGDASLAFDLSGTEWTGTLRRVADGAPIQGGLVQVDMLNGSGHAYSITSDTGAFHVIVRTGAFHQITAFTESYYEPVAQIPSVAAGADSSFDIQADVAATAAGLGTRLKPTPPAAPGGPAFSGEGPAFPRRSFRTGG